MLRENNVRAGFFAHEQYLAVLPYLPEPMRPVVTFACVTGWRINSEVLPLQWRQVDLKAGEVRLDPGTTKNMEGRVFYLTVELKKLPRRPAEGSEPCPASERHDRPARLLPRRKNESRRCRVSRRTRDFVERLLPCLVSRQNQGRMPGQYPARLPANSNPEHGPSGRAGARLHEAERPQDAQRVRPVQHRQRRRPAGCRAPTGGPSETGDCPDEEQIVRLSLDPDPAWRVDRYNDRSREASARGIADRQGTVWVQSAVSS